MNKISEMTGYQHNKIHKIKMTIMVGRNHAGLYLQASNTLKQQNNINIQMIN